VDWWFVRFDDQVSPVHLASSNTMQFFTPPLLDDREDCTHCTCPRVDDAGNYFNFQNTVGYRSRSPLTGLSQAARWLPSSGPTSKAAT